MKQQADNILELLRLNPDQIQFDEVISCIERHYEFTPTAFTNGDLSNQAGENNGSCKLFSWAKCQGLDEAQTLACFGAYYRDDVLKEPEGTSHQNIRQFMRHGWSGIRFEVDALQAIASIS